MTRSMTVGPNRASGLAWLMLFASASVAAAQVEVDVSGYRDDCEVRIARDGQRLTIAWPLTKDEGGQVALDLSGSRPLLESIETAKGPILSGVDPALFLTIGTREMPPGKPPEQKWEVFFDNPHRRPHRMEASRFELKRVRVTGAGSRATVVLDSLTVGPFSGAWELSFFAGSPLMLIDAVISTPQDGLAVFYDAGLLSKSNPFGECRGWIPRGACSEGDTIESRAAGERPPSGDRRRRPARRGGLLSAAASVPVPARLLDEPGLRLARPGLSGSHGKFGFGIRQNKDGGGNFVPWFNAPPDVTHRMGMFLLLSSGSAEDALKETLRYTQRRSLRRAARLQDAHQPLPHGDRRRRHAGARARASSGPSRPSMSACSRRWASTWSTWASSTATAIPRIPARCGCRRCRRCSTSAAAGRTTSCC